MSNTNRTTEHLTRNEYDKPRSTWQIERGERYGNNRKSVAKQKKQVRKLNRTRMNREIIEGVDYVY